MSKSNKSTNKKQQRRSPAQAAQSRKNGALSKGAITPEGKTIIVLTHMKHGFRARGTTLHTENREDYNAHLNAYLARYAPADKVEEDLVGLLAINMWQVMRMNSVEVALFDLELSGIAEAEDWDGRYDRMDQYGRLALAFKRSSGDRALELLRRYKSTAERAYHRALQALETIRQERKSQEPEIKSAEPPEKPQPDPKPPTPTTTSNAPTPHTQPPQPIELPKPTEIPPARDAKFPPWRPPSAA